jgi:hypothetical protein
MTLTHSFLFSSTSTVALILALALARRVKRRLVLGLRCDRVNTYTHANILAHTLHHQQHMQNTLTGKECVLANMCAFSFEYFLKALCEHNACTCDRSALPPNTHTSLHAFSEQNHMHTNGDVCATSRSVSGDSNYSN